MSRYWSGRVKMLLFVGIPCIICSLVLGTMPRNIVAVKIHIDQCNKNNTKPGVCMFDKAASTEFKMWLGVNITLIILTLYYGITHSINFIRCIKDHGNCNESNGCDSTCTCCQNFDCYDVCSDVCQSLNGFVYFYLISIGVGYYSLVDLICYIATPFFVTAGGQKNNSSMSRVVFVLGQYSGYASLCIGIAWIITLTALLPCITSKNRCIKSLPPIFGAAISFGLIFIIITTSSKTTMKKLNIAHAFKNSELMVPGLILGFTNALCYLVIYFIELNGKSIQENNELFDDSDSDYTPRTSLSNMEKNRSYAFEPAHSFTEMTNTYNDSDLQTSRMQLSTCI